MASELTPGRGPTPQRPADTDEGRAPDRPRIFIPWGPSDDGLRGAAGSVPSTVIDYYWPGIHTFLPDGTEAFGHRLPEDQTSTVVVDIANAGEEPAWVEVSLFWADPSVGFSPKELRQGPIVGTTTALWVNPGTTQSSPIDVHPTLPPIRYPHFCLLASISTYGSSPDGTWNPLTDAHYAQHNLDIGDIDESTGYATVPVWIVNPFPHRALIDVSIESASREAVETFAVHYHSEPADLPSEDAKLLVADGRRTAPEARLRVELAGHSRRLCHALVSGQNLKPGQSSVVEIRSSAVSLEPEGSDRHAFGGRAEASYGIAIVKP